MTEKLRESPSSKRTDGNQELHPKAITDRLIWILSEMGQPLHWRDVHLLAETDGFGEIKATSVRRALKEMACRNLVSAVEDGVYSLFEFTGETYELSNKITAEKQIVEILGRAGRPMNGKEIYSLAQSDDYGSLKVGAVNTALGWMIAKSLIVKLKTGVYSLPEFADEEYQPFRGTIQEKVKVLLKQAGRPLSRQEVVLAMEEDSQGELHASGVYSSLKCMARSGEIIRVNRGFYCLPEFTDEEYKLPEKTLGQRYISALWQAGRPLLLHEIGPLAEQDGLGKIKPTSVCSQLCSMIREKLVVRTERGVYSLPEFSYASEKTINSYITKAEIISKVIDILNEAGGSSHVSHIYLLLTTGNLGVLSLDNVSDMLDRIAQEDQIDRKIVRTGASIYSLSEFADQEYKEPPLKIEAKLLAILEAAGRPMHRYEIYYSAEEKYGSIRIGSFSSALSKLFNKKAIAKTALSVYSLSEFADEHYELPKLNINLRIDLSLLEARQPLHATEICRLVNNDGQKEVSLASVHRKLASMAELNKIVRVEPAVYSLPKFADEIYESRVKPNISARALTVLKEAKQPLFLQEICQRAEEDGYDPINSGSAKAALIRMAEKGTIVRAQRGFYSLPEFADKQI